MYASRGTSEGWPELCDAVRVRVGRRTMYILVLFVKTGIYTIHAVFVEGSLRTNAIRERGQLGGCR